MKALVIGHGAAGKAHEEGYRKAGIERIEVCDAGRDYRVLLPDAGIVSICTPDDLHFLQAVECLKAGKHVLVEKPPCTRPDELKYLMEWTAKNPGQQFACSLPLPWHFARLAQEAPRLGKLYLAEVEYNYGRKAKLMDGWRANPNYSMVLGGGLHMLDLLFWLTPERPSEGAAFGVRTTRARIDTVQAIMRFPSGMVGRLGVNGGYDGRHYHRVCLHGEQGSIVVENDSEVDKTAPVQAFVQAVKDGTKIDNKRLWDAMRVCFEIESQAL